VLAALDSVGLMEIAGHTELVSGRTGWLLYDCYGGAPLFTKASAETLWQAQGPCPVFLAVTEGRVEDVEGPQRLSSLLPAQVFALGQSSRTATGELIIAGEPYVMVLVRPVSAEQ
jgi:hypothetical protein